MKIAYVTLTGADDKTPIDGLLDVSAEFPFVEWGILFSPSRQGSSGYPSWRWLDHLCVFGHLHLAAHLCGQYVVDAMRGRLTVLEREQVDRAFGTIQLNCYKDLLREALTHPILWRTISVVHNGRKPVILGGNYSGLSIDVTQFLNAGVYPLFDASGGNGLSPKVWPAPFKTEYGTKLFCGYAGGLGPENVSKELNRINDVAGDATVWIDMQSKLRNAKDEFDLKKCRQVLITVRQWIDRNRQDD